MISNDQYEKMKDVLGESYSAEVLELLKERKVTKGNGTEFGAAFVRHVAAESTPI
ncbi:hypothetical protein [Flavobacterium sp. 3HN19-14]|uniref:hypothetical protein n=1 Tax=Flavobacterium sp. 3HN19-14 TaxID=3448133 RepID=UPI003EDF846C